MLKWIKASKETNQNIIYVDLILSDDKTEKIVSKTGVKITTPVNIKNKYKLDNASLNAWVEFVSSVSSIVRSYNFEIVDEYQNKKSYSYYIHFYLTSKDGRRFEDMIKIVFRLSDRRLHDSFKVEKQKRTLIKNFEINGTQYPSTYSVMQVLDIICLGLQQGDYGILDNY